MRSNTKLSMVGMISTSTLALGACTYTTPAAPSGIYTAAHYRTVPTYHSAYRPCCVVRAPITRTHHVVRTYNAPRIPPIAPPTQTHHSAPPVQTVRYASASPTYYRRPALRGAKGHAYGSIGGVAYDIDSDVFGVQARLGYQATPNFGTEVEGSIGVIDDDENFGLISTEDEIEYSLATFGVAKFQLAPSWSVHGRVGYHATRAKTTVSAGGLSVSAADTEDGIAYGAGTEIAVNPKDSVRFDYTVYDVDGPSHLDSVSVGYQRKF